MSEYQHYEFHSIDRPLSSDDMAAVGRMSSRVRLSSHKAVFTYSYSDYRYDAEEVLVDYFDFMLYIANWGTKRILMKFPLELVDYNFLKRYRINFVTNYDQEIRVLKRGKYVVIDIHYSEEEGLGWIDEGEYGYDFLGIRSEIMKGDYRSLFIIWLRFLHDLYMMGDFNPDYSIESELIPANLLHLSSSGYAAKGLFGIDEDWLAAMRSYSNLEDEEVDDYERRVLKMSKDQMIEYMRMILREESHIKIRLTKELKGEALDKESASSLIKLKEIGEKALGIEQERSRAEEKRRTREMSKRMNKIRQDKDQIEKEVIGYIEQGTSRGYRFAVSKLMELKAMNDYFETREDFEVIISKVSTDYSRKSSFIRMLREEELIK